MEDSFLALVSLQLATEGEQPCFAFLRHNGNGGGTQIKANPCRSCLVLWLLIGKPLQSKLRIVAIPLTIRSLCLLSACPTTKKAYILDPLIQAMLDHRIIPIDESRKMILLPHQITRIPFFWGLEDKPQPLFVGLALHAVQPSPFTLKPDGSSLP